MTLQNPILPSLMNLCRSAGLLAAPCLVLAACATKTAPQPPQEKTETLFALEKPMKHEMCWLSKKEITSFSLADPRKHTRPPVVNGREVSAIGIRSTMQNEALMIGVWFEKDNEAIHIQVAKENQNDVTKQPIPLDLQNEHVLKIDSTKAKRTSDNTWIWQGEIQDLRKVKKPKQHVFLFCARES